MKTLHNGFWEDKDICSGFHECYVTPNSLCASLTSGAGLAGNHTTCLPCCYWLNLKLQVDFASLKYVSETSHFWG